MNVLETRHSVLEACLRLADQGYLAGTGGNVAARAGDGLLVVTPSGRDYYALAPDDLCVLRLATLEQVDGPFAASVEAPLHARMMSKRPDLGATVHTHQPLASAVALMGVPVPLEAPEDRDCLGPHLATVPYAPSGTGLLVHALSRRIRPGLNAYLLRNHGLVVGGRDLAEAVAHAARVEQLCARFLHAAIQRAGGPPQATRFALSKLL